MEKKQLRNLLISLSLVIAIIVAGNIIYFGTDWLKPSINDNSDYSWDTDENRLTFPEAISNITLHVDFGGVIANKTIGNITLTDHYTTVFDILESECDVDYDIYWGANPTFFITSIDGVVESDANNFYWHYSINGSYIGFGANAYSPGNNSVIRWYYA